MQVAPNEPVSKLKPAEARVQFARVVAVTLPGADLAGALRDVIVPGTAASRYDRLWLMGQYEEDNGYLFGRIGFQAAGTTELWNEQKKDFEEAQFPAGTTSPFALRLATGELAFQRRPGTIRPTSFTGALQALMNEVSDYTRWRVEQESKTVPWSDWISSVDRVAELRFHLERPNPNYKDRKRVEQIIEGANASVADLVLKASHDDAQGLDVDDEIIRQAIDHATRKYGTFKAVGERSGEPEVAWKSDAEVVPERTIGADPATREAPHGGLRKELEDHSPADQAHEEQG
jgi:hypothetical protein